MSTSPEQLLVRKLFGAVTAIADGADEALQLIGSFPETVQTFCELGMVQRTAVRALLKAVEQQQDILARLFRTFLIAEQIDLTAMTVRDIANRMEKYGGLANAADWSGLVRMRNRLAHEYPVSASAQLDRVREAADAVPLLRTMIADLARMLTERDYLP